MSLIPCNGTLKGQTVFITGASRGIGKAIALKCAADGANVIIAAKTAQPHPKLPGTIYDAAKEIEALGGKALPVIVDVRDEDSVKEAVDQAVAVFGGIDVLVNNASALSLTPTEETSMKKYDLMHQVNGRGTFLCSKICMPYLLQSKGARAILNLSPPLDFKAKWFAPHAAYSGAKYLMSMYAAGMAAEFAEQGLNVSCLWPRVAVATSAINVIVGNEEEHKGMPGLRKVEIMSDAAYLILSQPQGANKGECKYYLDDTILDQVGIKNMDHYAYVPGSEMSMDFFIEDDHVGDLLPQARPAAGSKL
eukprot:Clim_evm16s236 gene=Clim_evmTU16s236